VIHFNFGLHDLETNGPTGPFATAPDNYTKNLELIWQKLAATGIKAHVTPRSPTLGQPCGSPPLGEAIRNHHRYNGFIIFCVSPFVLPFFGFGLVSLRGAQERL